MKWTIRKLREQKDSLLHFDVELNVEVTLCEREWYIEQMPNTQIRHHHQN